MCLTVNDQVVLVPEMTQKKRKVISGPAVPCPCLPVINKETPVNLEDKGQVTRQGQGQVTEGTGIDSRRVLFLYNCCQSCSSVTAVTFLSLILYTRKGNRPDPADAVSLCNMVFPWHQL